MNISQTLSVDWLTQPTLDVEFKQYTLLAYLKSVRNNFQLHSLYPVLSDLIEHHRNVNQLRDDSAALEQHFPKQMNGIDWNRMQFRYTYNLDYLKALDVIRQVVDFAIPQFDSVIHEGIELFEHIGGNTQLLPIGIMPLHTEAGYLLFPLRSKRATWVYEFQLGIFSSSHDTYRSIATNKVGEYPLKLSYTYETIKNKLLRQRPQLPNPATFAVESSLEVPLNETLMPIAKRMLLRLLAQG